MRSFWYSLGYRILRAGQILRAKSRRPGASSAGDNHAGALCQLSSRRHPRQQAAWRGCRSHAPETRHDQEIPPQIGAFAMIVKAF